ISDVDLYQDITCAILIGTSLSWLHKTIEVLRAKDIKAVVLSAQKSQGFGSGVSFITMDYEDALDKLIHYFESIGRSRTALFSVNPDSATDQSKRSAYLSAKPTHKEEDIYYFQATLDEVCRQLYDNIDRYDSVICTNHISEIVLSKFLSEQGYRIPEDMHIAVFGDSEVERGDRMIENTLIRIKPKEAGKLAVRSVRLLSNYPELSRVSFSICCDIITKDGVIDLSSNKPHPLQKEKIGNAPSSADVSSALIHEKILCNCDRVDIEILKGIIKHESYAKIASRVHISENTIGYRIKRLMQFAGATSKEEMIEALDTYLN
ncbi:MAG: hypothetical protein IJE84_03500, partial [Clostridia bacterium]|nr:hypothetical protein [Clostridia bacterium]